MSDNPRLKPKAYKSDVSPVWCPGCGHYAILSSLTKTMAHLELKRDEVAVVSGIGCSSRLPAYLDTYGFHGVHGRALPVASGLKVARPDLTVLAVGGDGDGFSIGGNHFLHACRRNLDLTYVVLDNRVYGMTKGQASPTTEPEWRNSKLTPRGTGMPRFRPAAIALASGAGFIARGFAGNPADLTRLLVEALQYPGFAFVHVLSPCVTFRPEQRRWKQQTHLCENDPTDDLVEAARCIQADDGFTLGILYRHLQPDVRPEPMVQRSLAQIEEAFLR